jgi:hypothetical protein
MEKVFQDIIATQTELSDVVTFEYGPLKQIAVEKEYPGVRSQIIGHLKKTRVAFDVDIGIGDVVYPEPQKKSLPTVLDGLESPVVYTYSFESTIAEKFHAILQRFEFTGRMKDFFDIYYLSGTYDFEGAVLQEAIRDTLQNRDFEYKADSFEHLKSLSSNEAMQVRWHHFQKAVQRPDLPMEDVLSAIDVFLRPVVEAIMNKINFNKQWRANERKWE